jgi:tRNA pseudouridine38-40 synthase
LDHQRQHYLLDHDEQVFLYSTARAVDLPVFIMISTAKASQRSAFVFRVLAALAVSFSTSITAVDGWMIVDARPNRRKGVLGRSFATHEQKHQQPSSPSLSPSSLPVSTTVHQDAQRGGEREEEYQESPSELRVLEFWDQGPFDTVQRMVRGMVTQNTTDMPRFSVVVNDNKEHNDNGSVNDNEKVEPNDNVFTKFYQGHSCRIQDSTDIPELVALASQPRRQPQQQASQPRRQPQQQKNRYNSFRLDVCYVGPSFCGWQRQPNQSNNPQVHQVPHLPSVQQEIEDTLAAALSQPKVNVRVSGRTDAGVHAVGQVARVRVQDRSLTVTDVATALQNDGETGSAISADNGRGWRCWRVSSVSDKFHPTFDTHSRSYVYLMDAQAVANTFAAANGNATTDSDNGNPSFNATTVSTALVDRLNDLLQPLQGRSLDYVGMSYGKVKTETTVCTLHHARAVYLVETSTTSRRHNSSDNGSSSSTAIAIELTGDRFLRRMVRILVATVMVLAVDDDASVTSGNINDDNRDRLLQLVQAEDRRLTAKAAPPMGLVFVGADIPVDDEDDEAL